jgi:membrane protease YdiL (CAAX protease family)
MMSTLLESLIHLIILTPLLVWAGQKNKTAGLRPIVYFALIYIVTNLLLASVSSVSFFQGQQWNWLGKGLALIAGLIFITIIPTFNRSSFGVTTKINWTETKPLLTVCFIYMLIRLGLYATSSDATFNIDPETILYQATLPGLQEELIYRGILLGLLSSAFTIPRFKFLKVNFGFATIITSLLFGFAHGITLNENLGFGINYFVLFRTTFDGFLFALLTEKTKSIFPNIVFHNVLNLIGQH